VLLDIHLGAAVGSGVDLIDPLRRTGATVVMLTGETDRFVLATCVESGAHGWIGKSAFLAEVVASIEDVLAGRSLIGRATREALLGELREQRSHRQNTLSPFGRLTPREQRVLGALIEGASAEEIAEAHVVALCTIRAQIRAILHKLGVRSQLAAVAQANRAGWRPPVERAQLVGTRRGRRGDHHASTLSRPTPPGHAQKPPATRRSREPRCSMGDPHTEPPSDLPALDHVQDGRKH
jgi:DNA-binding NarL/FixJ family response regulator